MLQGHLYKCHVDTEHASAWYALLHLVSAKLAVSW